VVYNVPVLFIAICVTVNELPYCQDLLHIGDVQLTSIVHRSATSNLIGMFNCLHIFNRVSHATICGTRYTKETMIVHSFCNSIPVFGKITDIIVTQRGECLFALVPYVTITFNTHYNAYEVEPEQNYVIVCKQKDFVDYHPLTISKSFDKDLRTRNFIVMKHYVFHDS